MSTALAPVASPALAAPPRARPPLTLPVLLDRLAAVLAMLILCASFAARDGDGAHSASNGGSPSDASRTAYADAETVASGYAGAPYYYRSDVALKQPGGTDLTLKRLGWDGDALYFPIDGGARVIRWAGRFGMMVDFLHNKAIARLGKGAHGRKIKDGVIEDVATSGTLKGQPAPSPLHLTDLFDRLEFTHGHNVLMLTGLARAEPFGQVVRPYVGVGVGVAVPHVEVWFTGAPAKERTNEYQYAGPAVQFLAGLELRIGRVSYYVEYKFIWSAIEAALTGSRSRSIKDLQSAWLPRWLIEPFVGLMEMPGDLVRQAANWWSGEPPAQGTLTTTLTSHEVVVGAGYAWPGLASTGIGGGPAVAP